jgi:hypothetical protein
MLSTAGANFGAYPLRVSLARFLAKEGHMAEAVEDITVEVSVVATEERVRATREESVITPVEEIQAEPGPQSMPSQSMPSIVEETVVVASVDPVAAITEAALAEDFEALEELGNEGLKVAKSLANTFSESFQMFAAEAADYSKDCFESRAVFIGALLGAKSLESAAQNQISYAKSAYARFMAHVMKTSGLYWNFLGVASKPIEKVTTKADRAKA